MAGINAHIPVTGYDYATVAASQTAQVLTPVVNGAAGTAPVAPTVPVGAPALAVQGLGDFLLKLIVIPGTTSPGAITLTDGSGSAFTVFTGGATSVADLSTREIVLNMASTSGPWKVTTGANVSVIAVGKFS
jgi:hypothetical protein